MGLFHLNKQKEPNLKQTPRKGLPPDRSVMAWGPEQCHCVGDSELDLRYNSLRVEEHALMDGLAGPEWSRKVALLPENRERNRYHNITPWDHARVKLPVNDGANDYINASWIQMGSKTYLASQGPLSNTVPHFWQMAYAYGGSPIVIVMLTALFENSVEKCAKYWPDSKDEDMYFPAHQGDFQFGLRVIFEKSSPNEHYNYSQMRLVPDDSRFPPKVVHHIYYYSWMDFSQPNMDADLRSLIYLVNNKLKNPGAPPIVHCSAGIGRTGTFIAIDSLLSKIDWEIDMSVAPETSPVWAGPPAFLINKDTPFLGSRESHLDLDETETIHVEAPTRGRFNLRLKGGEEDRSIASAPAYLSGDGHSVISMEKQPLNTPPAQTSTLTTALKEQRPLEGVQEEPIDCDACGGEIAPNGSLSDGSQLNGSQLNGEPPQANGTNGFESSESGYSEGQPDFSNGANGSYDGSNGSQLNGTNDQQSTSSSAKTGPTLGSSKSSTTLSSSAKTGPIISTAKTGPRVSKKLENYTVPQEILDLTPEKVDVFSWFDETGDPVLSAVRTMRLQRPKMVQGTAQLGYIYDQFEVGQQFARACGPETPERKATRAAAAEVSANSFQSTSTISETGGRDRKNSVSSTSSHKKLHRSNTFASISSMFTHKGRNRESSISSSAGSVRRTNTFRG